MNWKEYLKGFRFFWKGLKAAGRDIWVSFEVLFALTLVLSTILYFVEHAAQPQVYTNWWDAFVWSFMGYLGNPGKFAPGDPITFAGRILWIAIAILKIMIFAVPAGLVASGFSKAMAKEKRDQELAKYRKILLKSFKCGPGRYLRQYIDKLPKDENAWYNGCKFGYLVNNVSTSKFLLKGIQLIDILDVCKEYPEFRVKNEASAISIEDGKTDRFMLEHFPANRIYGFCADRDSKVTIVSTSSKSEISTGNFAYYLAKFAGFNYISKEFGAADDESFYNNHWTDEPFYEGITLEERKKKGEKITRKIEEAYKNKMKLREAFLTDLEKLCAKEGSWVICILAHLPNENNKVDVHIAHTLADGSDSTVHTEKEKFNELMAMLDQNLQEEMQLSAKETTLFPLVKRGTFRNLVYKLQDDGCKCNGFTMRVSSDLMEFNVRMRVAQFIMAKTIHDVLEPEHRLEDKEIKDMNRTSRFHGYADQKIDKIKKDLLPTD